jgi:hypothetical protein
MRCRSRAGFPVCACCFVNGFCLQLNGLIPAGSKGLNRESVKQYTGDIFALDAELSLRRALRKTG